MPVMGATRGQQGEILGASGGVGIRGNGEVGTDHGTGRILQAGGKEEMRTKAKTLPTHRHGQAGAQTTGCGDEPSFDGTLPLTWQSTGEQRGCLRPWNGSCRRSSST